MAETKADREKLEHIKSLYKYVQGVESKQRERENKALSFQVPENQWDAKAKKSRRGDGSTPGRPMLSISKIDQPIQLVLNQVRAAKLGVNVHPVSEEADRDGADTRQGLYRRIERDSNAPEVRLWAVERAVKAGRGAYRVNTKWDEDADPMTFDQEIVIERILHQDCVYFDPSAQMADFSDGEFVLLTAFVPIETFKRLYPNSKLAKGETGGWWNSLQEWMKSEPTWVTGEGDQKAVLVAEYWYKEHETEKIENEGRIRERDIVKVKCCKATGYEILEEQDWAGRYLPFVPVIGRELQPFDEERRFVGMIEPSMDGQMLYNYAASTLVEDMAMESKVPYIGAEGQFEGHEEKWAQANVKNFAFLEYKPVTLGDKMAPPPQRMQVDTSRMQLAMLTLQEADRFIQSTTYVHDPSLGRESSREKSGRAILALQQQGDAGTSHYLASMANVSMPLEARIILDLMPAIYDRPGRVTTLLHGDDDKVSAIMLNRPYVQGPDGRPMPAPEGSQNAKQHDLTKGAYGVSVSIGKSYQTRLQQGGEALTAIVEAAPDLMPLIGDLVFKFQDIPGAEEIAKRLDKWRERQFPGLGDGEDGQMTPEQAMVKVQALEQRNKLMEQQIQMLSKEIEIDRAKQEATVLKSQNETAAKERMNTQDNQTALAIAQMKAEIEELKAWRDHRHDTFEQDKDRAHDVAMAAAGGTSTTYRREGGQETGQEREQSREGGQSRETGMESESGFEQPLAE